MCAVCPVEMSRASRGHSVQSMWNYTQARKKSTKIKFLGPETARWGGGLPREGVVAENFVPAVETLSSLGFEERNPGCPGNFAGMSRTPGGVQKVCAKKNLCAIFRSLYTLIRSGRPGIRPQTVPGTLSRHTNHQIPLCVLY